MDTNINMIKKIKYHKHNRFHNGHHQLKINYKNSLIIIINNYLKNKIKVIHTIKMIRNKTKVNQYQLYLIN